MYLCFFAVILTLTLAQDHPQTLSQINNQPPQSVQGEGINVQPQLAIPTISQVQNQMNMGMGARKSYHQVNQERSAKYQAEQQRLYKQRRQQMIKYEQDAKISRLQQARNKERSALQALYQLNNFTSPTKTILFEVHSQIEQFVLTPTADSSVFISMLIYILQNNAYGIIKDVDTARPLKVYIYENNNRIVAKGQFLFEKGFTFSAKAGSFYVIRCYNEGQGKLISLSYPSMVQTTHIDNLYKKERGQFHLYKANILGIKIEEITQRLKRNSLLDRINNETMMDFLKKYSGYQFIEMFVVLAVCGFQVHMVKKLFKSDSIL